MNKHRIKLLDSFRFFAILSVLLYHYTARWQNLYPYGTFFKHIFRYGYLGVNFFFMISGFVISFTLENTPSLPGFFRNRFARLFPAMLVCSVLTFILIRKLDNQYLFVNAHKIKNFLPSLTFISPAVWTSLAKMDFAWISGSYWSLWTEIQFYLLSATIYFLNKKHYFRHILLAGILISSIKYIPLYCLDRQPGLFQSAAWNSFFSGWKYGSEVFNISFFILWFLSGVIFYQLYKGFRFGSNIFLGFCAIIVLLFMLLEIGIFQSESFFSILSAYLIMLCLFWLMIYRKKYLLFLENRFIMRIGIISYSIYLIHEDLGVLLINKYGGWLGVLSPLSPFIVIGLVCSFAELSYRFYERKADLYLKKKY